MSKDIYLTNSFGNKKEKFIPIDSKIGMSGWKNEKLLSDETLKNIYGKQAFQYFNQTNSSLFVFSHQMSSNVFKIHQISSSTSKSF